MMNAAPMLEGIKVVDLTSVVFGPYTTQVLSDFGADVIKVEPTSGDVYRYAGRPAKSRAMSPGHIALNRGKKSVTLDLKDKSDRGVMLNMLADADIFIHNVRDEAIKRLGLDYASIIKVNPGIIYMHCVGFGSDGPYSGLQAYDDVIQAATGATSLLSRVDGDDRPRFLPSLIADKVAGMNGAYAALAAVIHKLRTGRGQFVEVPMFEAFANFMLKEHLAGKTFVPPNGTACYDRQVDPLRQPFPTKDGHIVIVPYALDSWGIIFDALGIPEFMADERFATPASLTKNQGALYEGLAAQTPRKTNDEWLAIFREVRIPCMAVRDIEDILEDPHLLETGFLNKREHPTEGTYFELREASSFSDWDAGQSDHAPLVGEHNAEIRGKYAEKG